MRLLFILHIGILLIIQDLAHTETVNCNPKCDNDSVSEDFDDLCKKYNSIVFHKRCCKLKDQIIGYDLSGCNLTSFSSDESMKSLDFLFLHHNDQLNVTDDDFRGLIKLNYLRLPKRSSCPGDKFSWNTTEEIEDYTECRVQIDSCENNSQPCPPNSHCAVDGPGCQQCLCDKTFSGYKCLKEGKFPTFVYLVSWIGSTVVACALLFFYRRHQFKERMHTLPSLYSNNDDQVNQEDDEMDGPSMTHFASGTHRRRNNL